MTVRNSDNLTLTGWSAAGALSMILLTSVSTALVLAWPLAWLTRYVFGGGVVLRALVGPEGLNYRRCVGLFAIWFVARIRIKFSGPAQIKIERDL